MMSPYVHTEYGDMSLGSMTAHGICLEPAVDNSSAQLLPFYGVSVDTFLIVPAFYASHPHL